MRKHQNTLSFYILYKASVRSTNMRGAAAMNLIRQLMDRITILFPPDPISLRNALLRQQGKAQWQAGESGVFISIPEDYCDGRIYTTRLPARVLKVTADHLLVQAGPHEYWCHANGECQDGFGILVSG
jgi:hypothetical protein